MRLFHSTPRAKDCLSLLLALFFVLSCRHLAWAADVLPQYESSTVTIEQTSAAAWHPVVFAHAFSAPPAVVTGPVTKKEADPVTVRLRNVTTTGFEYQLDEWDYLDGIHAAESFSYLAVQTGTFQIGAVTWQAGRVAGVTSAAQPVLFPAAFASAPVVLAQVETVANSGAVIARTSAVTTTQFSLHIQGQQADTSTLAGESVGYLAASIGTAALDGATFRVGRTKTAIGKAWTGVTYGATCASPNFFAQPQTETNFGPVTLRQRNLSAKWVQVLVQKDNSSNTAAARNEIVGYLAMAESQGEIRAGLELGSARAAQPDRATWFPATFAQPHRNPIVVFGPLSAADADPARVRVRNVTATGFEYQVEEWAYQDGVHAAETMSYLVAEQGVYTIGRQRWAFGKVAAVGVRARVAVFTGGFAVTPAVFPQIVTAADPSPAHARIESVRATLFSVALEQEKAAAIHHAAETVDYLAVTPGSGRFVSSQIRFEAARPDAKVAGAFATTIFGGLTFATPAIFGATQSLVSARAIDFRFRNLTEKQAEFRLQEEDSHPPTAAHPPEKFGFLTMAGAVDLDGDGIADDWEVAHGLNPADPTDAALDADGDGFTNLEEFRNGTDPQVSDTGPVLTVITTAADAYRKEGTPAKFRISRAVSSGILAVNFTMSGVAAAATYHVTDAAQGTLAGTVTFPDGATFAEVDVFPLADAINRYPESVVITILPSGNYRLGASTTATATISDAAPTAANEQLFVAFLTRQGMANTYASGVGTLYLNGPKTSARVSLSFSGLSSMQTNAYLRYGNPDGVGTELRPTLGTGQVTNVIWSIVPAGPYSAQNIIDALFQKDGEFTYVNIGTGNYPVGEIAGTWTRQTGSTNFTPPADPPALTVLADHDLKRDVARFLTQATFGPTQADIDALVTKVTDVYQGDRIAAFSQWIDDQLALPQTNQLDLVQAADAQDFAARGTDSINYTSGNEPRDNNRRRSWWTISIKAHDQLRQRVAFALSELLVISDGLGEVKVRHYGTAQYYDLLAAAATGNYQTLLEDVSKSPMMGKFLSALQNQKAIVDQQTGQVLVSPDENYAREIMQLFSIGLVLRHPDGSLQLNGNGTPIPTYSNADITDMARVFTGWSFQKRNGAKVDGYPVIDNTNFLLGGGGPAYFQAQWMFPMINFAPYHDTGAKTVLGYAIPADMDGPSELSLAVSVLFYHQNTASFISRNLIQRLVTSNPSKGYVYRVAKVFADNGQGVRGDMKSVIRAILLDYEARSLEAAGNVGYGKQKEPIVRYIQLLRAGNAKSNLPLSLYNSYGYPSSQFSHFPANTSLYRYPITDVTLGQSPMSAPTVFNWFLPDFDPGGAIGAAGLVAPEMQLTTETGVIQALNYHYNQAQIDTGQSTSPLPGAPNSSDDDVILDRSAFEAIYDAAIAAGQTVPDATETLLDALDDLLMSGGFKARYATAAAPNPRSILLNDVANLTGITTTVRVKEVLYLILTTPEYIHQK